MDRVGQFAIAREDKKDVADTSGLGLAPVLDELAHGIAVVDEACRLIHANHAARFELGRRRVIGVQAGQVRPILATEAGAFAAAVARAASGKRTLLTVAADAGGPVTLAVLPMRREAAGDPPRVALVFARATVCDPLMLCFFARNHGLTAMEEQVLGLLAQGYSAPEAARQLDVAVSTVRSHVRSLCAKTSASSVRELVNRVALLPPVAPAFLHEPMH